MIMSWLWFILIGIVAGWLGSLVVKGSGSGLWMNLIIGILGGVLGGWIFGGLIHLPGIWGGIITATLGAIVLLLIVGLFTKKK